MFDTQARIHSLNGKLDTVTIIEHKDDNHVIAQYHGKYYTAIFNPFVGSLMTISVLSPILTTSNFN